jgi:glycine hydroxymethyltransferase
MNNKYIDSEIISILRSETERQNNQWNLIASENICYEQAAQLCSSVFTNKYAEGTPVKRYYQGCEYNNEIELLAVKRAQALFKSEYVNVQAHCGTNANLIAYQALLTKGDLILGMGFSSGGHLSHGHPKNISAQLYQWVHYEVDPITHYIDYNHIEDMLKKYRPKVLLSGASSYSRLIDYKIMFELAQKYQAFHMVDMAHIAGLVAAGVIESPVPYADIVTSTTHKTLRGPRGGLILSKEMFAKKIDSAVLPGVQGGPLMNMVAAKAWLFEYAQTNTYKEYQHAIRNNCQYMVNVFREHNVPIISDGSDNHLFVVDLTSYNKNGRDIALALEKENIIVNQNMIPFDTQSPFLTSGIRIGTPWITAQEKTIADIRNVALKIIEIIKK